MMKVVHIQIHEKLDGRLNETAFEASTRELDVGTIEYS